MSFDKALGELLSAVRRLNGAREDQGKAHSRYANNDEEDRELRLELDARRLDARREVAENEVLLAAMVLERAHAAQLASAS